METADVQDEVILPSPTSTEARPVDTTAIIEPGENTATEIQAHAEHKSGIEPTSDEPPKQTVSPISTIPPITTKTNPLPTHETSSFRISPSPISGHGAFALRSLKGGTILLRERPLLIATKHTLFERFGELSAEERAVATSLAVCDAVKFGAPVIQGVYETNAYVPPSPLSSHFTTIPHSSHEFVFVIAHVCLYHIAGRMEKESTGKLIRTPPPPDRFATNPSIHDAGLFPIAARFNHACHPVSNVVYHYDAEQDCLVLSVGEGDVAQGDELTISYGKEYTPLMLYTRYGFNCGCGACGGLSEEEIRELDPVW